MMDRPVIFSGPMVRAVLVGAKTQTRRLASSPLRAARTGDRLYVRENWRTLQKFDCLKPSQLADDRCKITYDADPENRNPLWAFGKMRPSIHMPRWASRLTLIIEAVRIEPLQSISRSDAIAEGLRLSSNALEEFWRWPEPYDAGHWLSPPAAYRWLWEQLHGVASWEANPDILVLTFSVVKANIDRI